LVASGVTRNERACVQKLCGAPLPTYIYLLFEVLIFGSVHALA